ncbi:AAA family ATPase [Angustibacter sp. McL0619]|uniref:AAA family ATPase n=1 Tax=Angustibacter sp. McL0619 TaxID=3415676 RepID=UPI003CEDDA8D
MSSAPTSELAGQSGRAPSALPGDPHGVGVRMIQAVNGVVRGSENTVGLVVCALLSGGHVLVEDLPGTGKTTLAKAVARAVGGSFARVQGTADLMPADVTGSGVWDDQQGGLRFVPGPVFANVFLVDELNRAAPRTQSALMEALDEGAVTSDGVRHELPDPFFAIGTQNPSDQHGTFALPEGELDRFALRVGAGELDLHTEMAVVREQLVGPTVQNVSPVVTLADLRQARAAVRTLHVAEPAMAHAVAVVRATRSHQQVAQGASSRAALALVRAAQARAALAGRDYVTPDDTKAVAVSVLAHRIVLHGATAAPRDAAQRVVADLLARVPVPLGT